MDFDEVSQFNGKAKKTFEQTTDNLIKTILDDKHGGEEFNVISSINGFETIVPGSDGVSVTGNSDSGRARYIMRRLFGYKETNLSNRNLQLSGNGLRVFIDAFIDVRSGTTFTTNTLIEDVIEALDEQSEREAFILSLQVADSTGTFSPINTMSKFKINNEEIYVIVKEDKPSALTYIGAGAGIAVCALSALVAVFLIVRNKRQRKLDSFEFYDGTKYNPAQEFDPRILS